MGDSLYKMSDDLRQVIENGVSFDAETGEVFFDSSDLEALSIGVARKCEAVTMYSKSRRALADARRNLAKQMMESARDIDREADKLDAYAVKCVELLGGKVETDAMTVKVRRCPPSVEVVEPGIVPDGYLVAKTEYKLDKKAIKAAIMEGEDVPGACLVYNKRLEIR